jgi:hypothetical protein
MAEIKVPTKEEVKEFWERCGFLFEEHNSRFEHWWTYTPPDQANLEWPERHQYTGDPPLDLNNLSRYAIPKLMAKYHNWKSVLYDWVEGLTGDYEKDALSLYWLLAQTML